MVIHMTFNHQEAGSSPAGPAGLKFIRITKNTEHNRNFVRSRAALGYAKLPTFFT